MRFTSCREENDSYLKLRKFLKMTTIVTQNENMFIKDNLEFYFVNLLSFL